MRISDSATNRLAVLKAIRHHGPVARTELPGLTGLSAGSITALTSDLVGKGIVVERRHQVHRPGRPRTLLDINPDGAIVVGASLRYSGIVTATFVDPSGSPRHMAEVSHGPVARVEDLVSAIAEVLDEAIVQSPVPRDRIGRVAIALPALLDRDRGIVHFITGLEADGPVPFAEPISRRLGLPVTIENDMTCMARAEHWFGRATALDSFALVHVAGAVGSAHYRDGLPQTGNGGFNAELGHTKVDTGPDARLCYCGGLGCVTAYASTYSMLQAAGEYAHGEYPTSADLELRFAHFIDRAARGNNEAAEALRTAGRYLGIALANLITASDPGHILVSVTNADFLAAIEEPMKRALREFTMPGMLEATHIQTIFADEQWRWRGTAALALEQIYIEGR